MWSGGVGWGGAEWSAAEWGVVGWWVGRWVGGWWVGGGWDGNWPKEGAPWLDPREKCHFVWTRTSAPAPGSRQEGRATRR